MKGLLIARAESRRMVPETLNTQIRGPGKLTHSRSEPIPLSARLETMKTLPPRPPTAFAPKPSADGKAFKPVTGLGDGAGAGVGAGEGAGVGAGAGAGGGVTTTALRVFTDNEAGRENDLTDFFVL